MVPPPPPPPAASVRELNRSISAGRVDRVYLLHGDEEYLRDVKIEALINSVLGRGERDFDLDTRAGTDLGAESLDAVLGTPPLLASRRVVVIKDVGSLRKGARQVLDRYIAAPAVDLVLILSATGPLEKSEKSLAASCTVVEFTRLKGDDLHKWIAHHAVHELGVRISPQASALLVSAVGDDLAQLASELDKLTSYSRDGTIEVSAVEDLVGIRHGETLADLLDAMAVRDLDRALRLLPHVLSQPKITAVSLLLALTTQTLGITYGRALLDEGEPASRLQTSLFGFLSAGKGAVTARPWGEAVRTWSRAVERWSSSDLEAACDALLRCDVRLKDTRASSDEQIITSLILELCAGGRSTPGQPKR